MKALTTALLLALTAGCAAPAFLQPAYPGAGSAQPFGSPAGAQPQGNAPAIVQGAPPAYAGDLAVPTPPAERPRGLDLGQAYGGTGTGGSAEEASEKPVVGWDGDVVEDRPTGATVDPGGAARGLEPSPTGRMYIIELYQQVLDERDALALEVESLNEALQRARGEIGSSEASIREREQRVAGLEQALADARAENRELIDRLTTAQIRRLEAEKMLLEAQIRWQRTARAAAEEGEGMDDGVDG